MELLKKLTENKTALVALVGFILGSALTYQITASYTSKQYEKTIESQRTEITTLQTSVVSLQSEMTKVKSDVVVVEKFDKNTGKIIERKQETKNETQTKTKKETDTETKKETEVKTVEKIVEKEVIVNNTPKNRVDVLFGLNQDLDKTAQFQYTRSFGLFDLGGAIQTDQQFKNKAVMAVVGFSF